jgi:hypothetical protein
MCAIEDAVQDATNALSSKRMDAWIKKDSLLYADSVQTSCILIKYASSECHPFCALSSCFVYRIPGRDEVNGAVICLSGNSEILK